MRKTKIALTIFATYLLCIFGAMILPFFIELIHSFIAWQNIDYSTSVYRAFGLIGFVVGSIAVLGAIESKAFETMFSNKKNNAKKTMGKK